MNKQLVVTSLLALAAWAPVTALAQAPKSVQIMGPNAAGGPNDLIARILSPKLNELLGQNFIVDNRPSANGVVAAEMVARAVPDGSVLGMGNSGTHAINQTLYKQLPYDCVRDFAPITEIVSNGLVVVTNPGVPAKNVKELIELAKRHQGKINVAVAGATGEVAGNAIKVLGKVNMTNIPYKGGVPAIVAVVAGESDLVITSYGGVIPHVKTGRMRALGVTGPTRLALMPDVPTLAESGLPGYNVVMWYGLFAPAKTPDAIVRRYYDAVARALKTPEVRQRLIDDAYDVVGSTPDEFGGLIKSEVEKYRKLILESGMTRL